MRRRKEGTEARTLAQSILAASGCPSQDILAVVLSIVLFRLPNARCVFGCKNLQCSHPPVRWASIKPQLDGCKYDECTRPHEMLPWKLKAGEGGNGKKVEQDWTLKRISSLNNGIQHEINAYIVTIVLGQSKKRYLQFYNSIFIFQFCQRAFPAIPCVRGEKRKKPCQLPRTQHFPHQLRHVNPSVHYMSANWPTIHHPPTWVVVGATFSVAMSTKKQNAKQPTFQLFWRPLSRFLASLLHCCTAAVPDNISIKGAAMGLVAPTVEHPIRSVSVTCVCVHILSMAMSTSTSPSAISCDSLTHFISVLPHSHAKAGANEEQPRQRQKVQRGGSSKRKTEKTEFDLIKTNFQLWALLT